MASHLQPTGIQRIVNQTLNWTTATVKAMILDNTYTWDETDEFVSDVVATEFAGTGYTGGFGGAGRKTVAGKTVTLDAANNRIELDCSDITWTALNSDTIGWICFFVEGASDAASPIVGFLDPADLVTNGSDVTLTINAEGAFQITYT